jgi:glycosyltransferase involved in cell wall biosynthesis
MSSPSSAAQGVPITPEVSVIVPVFNSPEYLEEAVSSILRQVPVGGQLPPSIEVLLVDDHSTDPVTIETLSRVAVSDGRIRLLKNRRTKGVSGARNTAIEEARSDWIAFCDSDDLWLETSLATRWRWIQKYPEVRWLCSGVLLWRPESGIEMRSFPERSPCLHELVKADFEARRLAQIAEPVKALLSCGCFSPLTVLAHRELLSAGGLFDESMRRAEDYLLWLRCAIRERLYFAPEDTAVYRLRPGSVTRSGAPTFDLEHKMIEKLRADSRFVPYTKEINQRMVLVLEDYCYHYRKHGQHARALRWALNLIKEAPTRPHSWKQLIAAALHAG